MGEKTFNLTWNNHLANLSGIFEGLYKSGSLTDTTLACHGGMLRAHKLVLAACSPYFERVFKEHYGSEQPILILKGVPIEEMECLLDFMYRGSINVAEEHLPSLIKTATDLEIRGLSGDHRSENSNNIYSRAETKLQNSNSHHDVASIRSSRPATIDYYLKKAQTVSFLSKQNCGSLMTTSSTTTTNTPTNTTIPLIAGGIVKMEEIEVEDDPMVVMEGMQMDDNYDDDLRLPKSQQIRHVPTPMYNSKRHNTRYDGYKRNLTHHGRILKENDITRRPNDDSISPGNDECMDSNGITIDANSRLDLNYSNSNSDPTVPAIQMVMNDDDSMDPTKNLQCTETLDEDPEGNSKMEMKIKMECDVRNIGISGVHVANTVKERKVVAQKSKAQYKPFPCDLCTLAFTRASHLARHRRVHTGERPFACNLCPRMFARQDKLKQHLDSHYQWPKRKSMVATAALQQGNYQQQQQASSHSVIRGKRGRPRKVAQAPATNIEETAMEEILKFGEFSSMLNNSKARLTCAPAIGSGNNCKTAGNPKQTMSQVDIQLDQRGATDNNDGKDVDDCENNEQDV